MHAQHERAVVASFDRERVVEILRIVGIDRENDASGFIAIAGIEKRRSGVLLGRIRLSERGYGKAGFELVARDDKLHIDARIARMP